jgi:hypothetical protein
VIFNKVLHQVILSDSLDYKLNFTFNLTFSYWKNIVLVIQLNLILKEMLMVNNDENRENSKWKLDKVSNIKEKLVYC